MKMFLIDIYNFYLFFIYHQCLLGRFHFSITLIIVIYIVILVPLDRMKKRDFKINEYITLRFESNKTNIYINDKKFIQCKFLLLEVPLEKTVSLEELESIDEFSERFGNPFDIQKSPFEKVPPEVEFWGHCSNLQVWVEHDYNSNLLHSDIAFPLLKRLTEVGDARARGIFKDEIIKRILSGYIPTVIYLVMSHFLDFFRREEIKVLTEDIKSSEYIFEEKIEEKTLENMTGRILCQW